MEQDAYRARQSEQHAARKDSADFAPSHYLRLLKSHNPNLARLPATRKQKSGRLQRPAQPQPNSSRRPPPTLSHGLVHEADHDPAPSSRSSEPKSRMGDVMDSRRAAAAVFTELAATEQCPHCSRRFSREAAARHVPICAGIKSRPKAPKEPMVYFTDALGRRQASPKAEDSVFNASTPSRSRRPRAVSPFHFPSEVASESRGELKQQWSLVQFLLRDGLEAVADDSAIMATARGAQNCLEFLDTLEDYARKLGMRTGALSRMLLPFNSETDSGDQANTALEAPLGSSELDGLLPDHERQELVHRAVALRRLVRVKVADCADVEQARDSLQLIVDFLNALRRTAEDEKRSLTCILREL